MILSGRERNRLTKVGTSTGKRKAEDSIQVGLPDEIWHLILTFISRRARLLALSLVSKSWRRMVLQTMQSVNIANSSAFAVFPAAVALFPIVTELQLCGMRYHAPIPELRDLHLPFLRSLLVEFPTEVGLWSYYADGEGHEHERPRDREEYPALVLLIDHFIARHASLLETLVLECYGDHRIIEPSGRMLSKLCFPRLKLIDITGTFRFSWKWREAMPNLETLSMRHWVPWQDEDIDSLPLLPKLRRIYFTFDACFVPTAIDKTMWLKICYLRTILQAHTSLIAVRNPQRPEKDDAQVDDTSPLCVWETVYVTPLERFHPHRDLRFLKTVKFNYGSRKRGWNFDEAIDLLRKLMRLTSSIKQVYLYVTDGPRDGGESFIKLALQYGLHEVIISGNKYPWTPTMAKDLARCGWLQILSEANLEFKREVFLPDPSMEN